VALSVLATNTITKSCLEEHVMSNWDVGYFALTAPWGMWNVSVWREQRKVWSFEEVAGGKKGPRSDSRASLASSKSGPAGGMCSGADLDRISGRRRHSTDTRPRRLGST
jgi:hypothetical protein